METAFLIDLLDMLVQETQGLVPAKLEGLASIDQVVFLSNNNEGVKENNPWNL